MPIPEPVVDETKRARKREYMKTRAKTDPAFRFVISARCRLRSLMLGAGQRDHPKTRQFIGCSAIQFRTHIESLWKPGMSWANYGNGGWVIDHRRPCSMFDLTDPREQRACFNWTNLQPLWEQENRDKGSRAE